MPAMSSRPALRDGLFLAAIVLLSSSLYVARLGFYSDDWSFLDKMSRAGSGAIPELFRSLLEPRSAMRPGELLCVATLYSFFGLQPIGYHLANSLIFVLMAVFLYLALRELNLGRLLAVSIALVFVLLPHYSANRFWFSTVAHTLSMALYFVSLYALLRALKARDGLTCWSWLAASLGALAASGMCYEVPLPFFVLNAGIAWRLGPRLAEKAHVPVSSGRVRAIIAGSLTIASTVAMAAFKWWTTVRLGSAENRSTLTILRKAWKLNVPPESYGLNIEQALRTSFGDFGVGLPRLILQVLREGPPPSTLVLTLVAAVAIAGYLLALARSSEAAAAANRAMALRLSASLLAGGFGVFWIGYAIFLTNSNVQFTTTGIGNRASIGAAAGVALVLVGVLYGVSGLWSSPTSRGRVFGLMVAMLCASSILLNNVLALHWIRASDLQRSILADIHRQQPSLPPRSTLILDGVCPYVGPAIVFETRWDLRGALRIMYRDASIDADVATTRMVVAPQELSTEIYSDVYHYPFGDGLLVYDHIRRGAYPLNDSEAARRYFAARPFSPTRDCPPGHEGLGAPAW
jgi:hypothetical protein